MKKILVIVVIAVLFVMFGGGDSDESSSNTTYTPRTNQTTPSRTTQSTPTPIVEETPEPVVQTVGYEEVYNTYASKLREEGNRLLNEFDQEKIGHESEIDVLAELANDKVMKLAEIETEGVEKLAEVYWVVGGAYETYENWANQLYAIYDEEGQKIYDDYMNSYTISW